MNYPINTQIISEDLFSELLSSPKDSIVFKNKIWIPCYDKDNKIYAYRIADEDEVNVKRKLSSKVFDEWNPF